MTTPFTLHPEVDPLTAEWQSTHPSHEPPWLQKAFRRRGGQQRRRLFNLDSLWLENSRMPSACARQMPRVRREVARTCCRNAPKARQASASYTYLHAPTRRYTQLHCNKASVFLSLEDEILDLNSLTPARTPQVSGLLRVRHTLEVQGPQCFGVCFWRGLYSVWGALEP